jgi:selenocysteine lyase/cysteine desulfurase
MVVKKKAISSYFHRSAKISYLDNAATNRQPRLVTRAIVDYYRYYAVNTHSEGSNKLQRAVTTKVAAVRQAVQRLLADQQQKGEVVFFASATQALNLLALS